MAEGQRDLQLIYRDIVECQKRIIQLLPNADDWTRELETLQRLQEEEQEQDPTKYVAGRPKAPQVRNDILSRLYRLQAGLG